MKKPLIFTPFLDALGLRILMLLFAFLIDLGCKSKLEHKENASPVAPVKRQIMTFYSETLPIEDFNDERITKEKFYSGAKSLYVSSDLAYSSGFKLTFSKVLNSQKIDSLDIKLKCFSENKLKDVKVVWSIDDAQGKNLFWSGSLLDKTNVNTWNPVNLNFKLDPQLINKNNILSIYVWNQNKESFWIDDFEFALMGKVDTDISTPNVNSNFYYDFENSEGLLRPEKISVSNARSGKMTCNLSDGSEYGIGVKKYFNDFGNQIIRKLAASVWVYPTEKNHDLVLTFSCVDEKNGKVKFWQGKGTTNGDFPLNQWTILNSAVDLPVDVFNINDPIEVGLWNKGKTSVYCDDLHIVYGDQPKKKSINSEPNNNSAVIYGSMPQKLLMPAKIKMDGLKSFEPKDQIVFAKFYKNSEGLESILHIKKEQAKLLWYNQKSENFELIWETKDKNNFILSPNNYFQAGDFDGDNKGDLLVVNKSDLNWALYNFEANQWVLKLKGTQIFPGDWLNEPHKYTISNQLSSHKKSVIVNCSNQGLKLLMLENNKWVSNFHTLEINQAGFKNTETILDWNENAILKLNTAWRFELKQIILNNNRSEMAANIDFKKDAAGINPKYYEYSKLFSGNFISNKSKQLLIAYFNCLEENFDGINCEQIEKNNDFPNGIGIYF